MTGTGRSRFVPGLLLAVIATVLPLFLLELGLRLFTPQRPAIYDVDERLLHRLVPGGRKTYDLGRRNGGGKVLVSINGEGFRGPPLSNDPRVRRVVVYGDSFIEGEFSPDEETYVRVLERRLHTTTSPPIEVVNAGVIGYGPDQLLLRMQGELARLKPSLVIIALYADNDFGDLVRNRMFRLTVDSQLVPNHYVLSPAIRTYLTAQAHPTGIRRLHLVRWIDRTLERRRGIIGSVVSGMAPGERWPPVREYVPWALERGERQYREFVLEGRDTVTALLGDHYDADIPVTPDAPSSRYKLAAMERLLAEMRRTLDARGVPGLVLLIPSPIDACETYDYQVDSLRYPGYDRFRMVRELEAMTRRAGLPVLNFLPRFRELDACTLYFRFGNNHWNRAGQAAAAQVTADSLERWGLVP